MRDGDDGDDPRRRALALFRKDLFGVANVSSVGTEFSTWVSSSVWHEQWSQMSVVDNTTTPECRMVASEIFDLGPKVEAVMADAEREAVAANIWTWLQRDVPEKLAAELWTDRLP